MEKYKFLSHTADAKFQAFGKTLEEAFRNAALATASLMWDPQTIERRKEHRVEVAGKDQKQLLNCFLEEIIYLFDSQMFLLGSVGKVRIEKKGNRYSIKALFKGDKYSNRYKLYGDVKAVTYNEMKIEKRDHFMVQVVVDV
jgi:SHS2 domain-containing protein